MEHTHQQNEEIVSDFVLGFAVGNTQAHIERIAASFAVSGKSLAAGLGALLLAAPSGPGLGPQSPVPKLLRGSRTRNSVSESMAVARYAPGDMRQNEVPQNGKLKHPVKHIVLHALRQRGKVDSTELLHNLVDDHPDLSFRAFQGTLNRLAGTGSIKRQGNGLIKLTAIGASQIDDNEPPPRARRNMSAAAKKRISLAQRKRWAARKGETEEKNPVALAARLPRGQMWQRMRGIVEQKQPIKAALLAQSMATKHGLEEKTVYSAIKRFYATGLLKRTPGGAMLTAKGKREGKDDLLENGNGKRPTIDAIKEALGAAGPLLLRRDVISAVQKQHPDMTPKAIENALQRGVSAKHFMKTEKGFALAASA